VRVNAHALELRLDALVDDVGWLRRRLDPDSSAAHLAERIACRLLDVDSMLRPSAAEIAATWHPGDEDAISEAIRIVDSHDRERRHRLGLPEPCSTGRSSLQPLTVEERECWRRLYAAAGVGERFERECPKP
jgi:hypothetical protein